MNTLTHEIDSRLVELAVMAEVSKSDLISIAIQVIEEEYGSMSKIAPTDRFELILAKIVLVFQDEPLDLLYTAFTNRGPLLGGTQTMHTEEKIAS